MVEAMDGFFASLDPWMVYVVIGALTFGESAAFLGLLFPGEVALVAAGAVAVTVGVDPVTLAIVAAACSSAGGLAGYEIGRRYGARLVEWRPVATRVGPHLTRVAHRLAGPGATLLVALGRFNQATRAAVPALAGMAPMRWSTFAVANTAGGVVWALTFTLIGFYAAEWWRVSSGPVQVVLAVVLACGIGAWFAVTRTTQRRPPA